MLAPSKIYRRPQDGISTRSNLRASTADGAAFGVMVGLGETFLAAFALAVGMSEVAAGLVSSLPLLAGGLLQLVSLWAVRLVGSEKRWVIACATLQGLAFVPLVIAACYGSIPLAALLLIASVYWGCGLASGPAWNTWMQGIVPARLRATYFARRTRASQLTTFVSFLLGGLLLEWARRSGTELTTFALLFLGAGLFRLISVACLVRHHALPPGDRQPLAPPRTALSLRETAAAGGQARASAASATLSASEFSATGRRLLVYLVVVQGMVQISGPYFTPFMLEQLDYSYSQFVTLTAVAFAAKGVALAVWASLARRRGAAWLLWVGGCGIAPMSLLWVVSQNFFWLVAVQIFSGALWAAYELGFFLLFFETLPLRARTKMLTLYNLGNTFAWCGGSLVGAALLSHFGASHGAYMLLFTLSSVGRILAIGLLMRTLPIRLPIRIPVVGIGIRMHGVRPGGSGVDVPILPSIPATPNMPASSSAVKAAG
ncbi:MFS transporter [Candidatus Laterigemmans baculatus]|uniref:MFS transporter n=1 Tax=Candidatus Laterigemmans baculatus TaxID=2770505 RepID=UPI0013D92FCF|nr:MFS transporter [Candidatus Laterigemmans baculatus]